MADFFQIFTLSSNAGAALFIASLIISSVAIQLSRFSGGNMSLPSTNPKQPAPQESSREKLFDFFR